MLAYCDVCKVVQYFKRTSDIAFTPYCNVCKDNTIFKEVEK
jgi:ribosomal protein L33